MRLGIFGKKVAGYCHVCGSMEDESHLIQHDDVAYCPRCYKPVAAKLEEEKRRSEIRKRHGRHHLVIEYLDGRKEQGRSLALNIREPSFRLDCEDDTGAATGQAAKVKFSEIKCVKNVKSYIGKFDAADHPVEVTPGGSHVIVEFQDDEVAEGVTVQAFDPEQPRFYLIPLDPQANEISILVEMSAVSGVYSPNEYRDKQEAERETKPKEQRDQTAIGQDESMGDFYFETHNYPSALEQYKSAHKQNPDSRRLTKKMTVATINIGIQHIKERDYRNALEFMEKALELDPNNPHAEKKAKQLRKTIEKTERRMQEYAAQHAANREQGGGSEPPNPT